MVLILDTPCKDEEKLVKKEEAESLAPTRIQTHDLLIVRPAL